MEKAGERGMAWWQGPKTLKMQNSPHKILKSDDTSLSFVVWLKLLESKRSDIFHDIVLV